MAYKILLADDSVTVQKIITLTFSDEGVDVEAVNNGDDAINKLHYLRPSLVMADVSIPGKDGYQICEYVKTHPELSHIPVILLVPAFEPFDAEKARRMGADHHLTKPFQSIRTLITTVKNLIEPPPPGEAASAQAEITDVSVDVLEPRDGEIDNVLDMTSRIAPARHHEERDNLAEVVSSAKMPDRILLMAEPGIHRQDQSVAPGDELDNILDIDDVLGETWESAADTSLKAAPEADDSTATSVVISQSLIDEIANRVVAQLTDSLAEKLAPMLREVIINRMTPEIDDRDTHQPDDRQLSLHDPDTLLEIDEI